MIDYEPAESRTSMYGGNSNWRGPVWFPVNYLVIRSLLQYEEFFGDDVHRRVPHRLGSAAHACARSPATSPIASSASGCPAPTGPRPVFGGIELLRHDPAWKDNLLFHEYFHGDNGAGLGAAHQTGWTALVADLILDPPGHG